MDLAKLFSACERFHSLIVNSAVIDISEQLAQNKIKRDLEKAMPEIQEPNPSPLFSQDELAARRQQKSQSEFQSQIQEEAGVWMHRFSDVRKDDQGFFILKQDNPAGNQMAKNQLLADYSLNGTPYWSISSIQGNRINLKPIGPNPFLTGIGAGGAKLNKYDFEVFTGEAERKRIEFIKEKLEQGTAAIDDVKYLLDGTVPVQMGPNGAQGGWYNPNDSASRGGRKGMKPEQIMLIDAKKLQTWGFSGIPTAALNGSMDPGDWGNWIDSNGSDKETYHPKDIENYVDFHRRMTQKGKYRYDEQALQDLYKKHNLEHFEQFWEQVVEDFTKLPREEYKAKYPYYPETLKEIVDYYTRTKTKIEQEQNLYLSENETPEEESILRNIFHKERRVAIRNTMKLIEMAKENSKYIKYLHDMLSLGGADYFANEKVIEFFDLIDDVEGLKIAAEKLKDADNLRFAYRALMQHEPEYVLANMNQNTPIEALKTVLYKYSEQMAKTKPTEYKDWIINFFHENNIFELIRKLTNNPKDYYNKLHCEELLDTMIRSFRDSESYLLRLRPERLKDLPPELYEKAVQERAENEKYIKFIDEAITLFNYVTRKE